MLRVAGSERYDDSTRRQSTRKLDQLAILSGVVTYSSWNRTTGDRQPVQICKSARWIYQFSLNRRRRSTSLTSAGFYTGGGT